MKYLISVALFLLIANHTYAQASGSTEFELEIQLLESTTIQNYELYVLEHHQGVNYYSSCSYTADSLNNRILISGSLNYIVGADILELILVKESSKKSTTYSSGFETREHFIIHIERLDKVIDEINFITLNKAEPFLDITAEFIDKKLKILTNAYAFPATEDQKNYFQSLFMREWMKVPRIDN
jgi:hypothetical protein